MRFDASLRSQQESERGLRHQAAKPALCLRGTMAPFQILAFSGSRTRNIINKISHPSDYLFKWISLFDSKASEPRQWSPSERLPSPNRYMCVFVIHGLWGPWRRGTWQWDTVTGSTEADTSKPWKQNTFGRDVREKRDRKRSCIIHIIHELNISTLPSTTILPFIGKAINIKD